MKFQDLYANLNALLRSIRESQRAISMLRDVVDYGEDSRFLLSLNEKLLSIEGTISDELLASKMLKPKMLKVEEPKLATPTTPGKKRGRPPKISVETPAKIVEAKEKAPEPKIEEKPKAKPGRKPGIKVAKKPGRKPGVKIAKKPGRKPGVKIAKKPGRKPEVKSPIKAEKKPKAQLTNVTPGWIIGYSILEVLSILDGKTTPWVITKSIYKVLENQLTAQDKQPSFAATQRGYKGIWATHIGDSTHRERKRLTDMGLLESKAPKGIWILSKKGKEVINNVSKLSEAYKNVEIPKIKAVKVLFDFSTQTVQAIKDEESAKLSASKKPDSENIASKKRGRPKKDNTAKSQEPKTETEAGKPEIEGTTFAKNFQKKKN